MQLTGKSSLRCALTAITASLLGTGAVHAEGDNHLESSILLYSEVDRVQAGEGIIGLTHTFKGDLRLNARLTVDGLTGASPNGAVPSSRIQTFTSPSGNGSYTVKAGEMPLDDTFKDARLSFDGSLSHPLNRITTLVYGAHLSAEHDYTSLGANLGISRDFNHRNTTLSATAGFSHDIVRPLGGTPTPLGIMAASNDDGNEREGEDDGEREGESGPGMNKNVLDAVLGVTQVLDRKTILMLNYSLSHMTGYLNDPYKILSVVQGPGTADPGEPVNYIYESRPDNRTKQAFYAELRRYIGGHTLDLSYRYYHDSWGINSHTVDLHYRLPLTSGHALQPHVRWYRQTEADFYHTYLVDGAPAPAFASADYRLAPFQAVTVGLQYLYSISTGLYLSLGAEYYRQAGDISPPPSMGILSRSELFPTMDAVMVRLGFSRDF